MTAALEGGEWSAARPGRTLPPGKTRYPFHRRLGGSQGRSGRTEKSRPYRDSIPDRPARSSVAIPTELPGSQDEKCRKYEIKLKRRLRPQVKHDFKCAHCHAGKGDNWCPNSLQDVQITGRYTLTPGRLLWLLLSQMLKNLSLLHNFL